MDSDIPEEKERLIHGEPELDPPDYDHYEPVTPLERAGQYYRSYYFFWQFLSGLALYAAFSWVSFIPYLKLSEAPLSLLGDKLNDDQKRALLIPIWDGLIANAFFLYPPQTLQVCVALLRLLQTLVLWELHFPFLRWCREPLLAAKYTFFLAASGAVGFAAYLAAQIFRNALDHQEGLENWIIWGMVFCRFAIIFKSLMRWVCDLMSYRYLADTESLYTRVKAIHKHLKSIPDDLIAGKTKAECLYELTQKLTYEEYIYQLIDLARATGFNAEIAGMLEESSAQRCCRYLAITLKWLLALAISVMATTGQYLGVMNYYDIDIFGYLALGAIAFGLYLENVKDVLDNIFSKDSYKKDGLRIALQIITVVMGLLSGFPSMAVVLAAKEVTDKGSPLIDTEAGWYTELIASYMNALLLNSRSVFKTLEAGVWWGSMLLSFMWWMSHASKAAANRKTAYMGMEQFRTRLEETLYVPDLYMPRTSLVFLDQQVDQEIDWHKAKRQEGSVEAPRISTRLPHIVTVLRPKEKVQKQSHEEADASYA